MSRYSIILPVRNGGSYVKECIQSILFQTYQDFQLHILENGSTDGTAEWLRTLNDPRIILLEASQPLSIEENWGRIIHIPKNEFITLIGHDDILYKDYLAEMDQLIQKKPNAGLYQAHFHFIDSNGEIIRDSQPMEFEMNGSQFISGILKNEIDMMGTGFMMRSADFDRIGGIPPYPNLLFADFEMVVALAKDKGICVSPKALFAFRIHNSTTKSSADARMQSGFERLIQYLHSLQKSDPGLSESIKRYGPTLIQQYCKGLSHRLMRSPLKERNNLLVKDFLKKCKSYHALLTGNQDYVPEKDKSVWLAKVIDSNAVTRNLFLLFKRVYPKPVLK